MNWKNEDHTRMFSRNVDNNFHPCVRTEYEVRLPAFKMLHSIVQSYGEEKT